MNEVWDETDFLFADKHQRFARLRICFNFFCHKRFFFFTKQCCFPLQKFSIFYDMPSNFKEVLVSFPICKLS